MVTCFVPDCNHSSNDLNRKCGHFFRFPADEKLRTKWISNIGRSDKEPSKCSSVCSCHFKDENKTNGPTIFKRNEAKIMKYTSPENQQGKPDGSDSTNLPSTSAETTTCDQSTQTYKVDNSTQTDPSLHLQLREMDEEIERSRARNETIEKLMEFASTGGIEDEDEDLDTTSNMAEYASQVFQFKISLQRIKPQIWRRIQVPADFNFRELHLAIQCAMGWQNCHLYVFRMGAKKIDLGNRFFPFSIDDDIRIGNVRDGDDIISALDVKLPRYFKHEKSQGVYEYDFGRCWDHDVVLEKILPKIEGETYPKCIGGKRACPPEDGVYSSSDSEDDDEARDWKRKRRDPELFDLNAVKFDFEFIDNDF